MGVVRLLLALMVLEAHGVAVIEGYGHGLIPTFFPYMAREAVQIFYIISGFYMSLILTSKYSLPRHNVAFYSNRFLRLWPTYFVVAVALVVLFLMTGTVRLFETTMATADYVARLASLNPFVQIYLALTNLLIVGQDWLWFLHIDTNSVSFAPYESSPDHNGASYSINSPIFTVAIEAMFYLVAPFILRRRVRTLLIVLAACGAYHVVLFLLHAYTLAYAYHLFLSAGYFFMLGACAYHLWRYFESRKTAGSARPLVMQLVGAALLLAAVVFVVNRLHWIPVMLGYGLAFALVLPLLFSWTRRSVVDRTIGDLSYPVYVVHVPVVTALMPLLLPHVPGWMLPGVFTGLLVLALSLLLLFGLEKPIDGLRARLATRATGKAAVLV